MNIEEYKLKMQEDEDWSPGWDAIDRELVRIYKDQEPSHYGTDIDKRALFGGNEYLDGFSIYNSKNGYKHLITYGMTDLYACVESFEDSESGWGYEMTIKLNEEANDNCIWAINMLSNIAYYSFTQGVIIEPNQYMGGKGTSLHEGVESMITSLLFVSDSELDEIATPHGKVKFLQLFGLMELELEALRNNEISKEELISNIKLSNPNFITDMKRTKSYIEV